MASKITHPVLGPLQPDDFDGWGGRIRLSGFDKFGWPSELDFHIPGGKTGPDPLGVELILPLVAHSATLADVILDGLWAELDGRETENGHWWAKPGGLATVNEGLDEPITQRDDLVRVLQPDSVFVRDDVHGDDQLTAGVNFVCEFEQEHGLDVLTDGVRVLGTGYALEVEKYQRYSAITAEEREARHRAARERVRAAFNKKRNG